MYSDSGQEIEISTFVCLCCLCSDITGAGRRAKWLVASAWVLSIAFSIPIIFLYHLAVPEGMAAQFGVQVSCDWWRSGHMTTVLTSDWSLQCWINFPEQWHWRLYMTLVSTSLFFIPAVTIYRYLLT